VDELIQRDQQAMFADQICDQLNGRFGTFHFGEGETYVLKRDAGAAPALSQRGE